MTFQVLAEKVFVFTQRGGMPLLGHHVHDWAAAIGSMASANWTGAVEWFSKASMDGIFGLVLGMCLIFLRVRVIEPAWSRMHGK